MTVKFYLGKGFLQEKRHYKWAHENSAVRKICQGLYDHLQQSKILYAVIANPGEVGVGKELTPDMVVISELGLGVIELKDWAGVIDWGSNEPNQPWRGHTGSPFQQVNEYARVIYEDLTYPATPDPRWLPAFSDQDKSFFYAGRRWIKIFTTACFTNRGSDVSLAQNRNYENFLPKWGNFRVTIPSDLPDWVVDLRFEHDWDDNEKKDKKGNDLHIDAAIGYQPFQLLQPEVEHLAKNYFHSVEWTDMYSYVQEGHTPYAFLKVVGTDNYPLIRIDREEVRLGRSEVQNPLNIPLEYKRVSRKHIRIVCEDDQVFIEDIGSQHGTYLSGGIQVTKLTPLVPHQQFLLGGPVPGPWVCLLELVPPEEAQDEPTAPSAINPG